MQNQRSWRKSLWAHFSLVILLNGWAFAWIITINKKLELRGTLLRVPIISKNNGHDIGDLTQEQIATFAPYLTGTKLVLGVMYGLPRHLRWYTDRANHTSRANIDPANYFLRMTAAATEDMFVLTRCDGRQDIASFLEERRRREEKLTGRAREYVNVLVYEERSWV